MRKYSNACHSGLQRALEFGCVLGIIFEKDEIPGEKIRNRLGRKEPPATVHGIDKLPYNCTSVKGKKKK